MISETDMDRIMCALQVASTSHHRYKVGAVLVIGGRVMSTAANKSKNNPRFIEYLYCTVHAEIGALRQVRNPKGATVYIARLAKNGTPAMAKPCQRCFDALVVAGVQRAVWTTDDAVKACRLTRKDR